MPQATQCGHQAVWASGKSKGVRGRKTRVGILVLPFNRCDVGQAAQFSEPQFPQNGVADNYFTGWLGNERDHFSKSAWKSARCSIRAGFL